jgi:hypothetical protein
MTPAGPQATTRIDRAVMERGTYDPDRPLREQSQSLAAEIIATHGFQDAAYSDLVAGDIHALARITALEKHENKLWSQLQRAEFAEAIRSGVCHGENSQYRWPLLPDSLLRQALEGAPSWTRLACPPVSLTKSSTQSSLHSATSPRT